MTPAVVIDDLSKRYTLGDGGGYRRLTEVLTDRVRGRAGRAATSKDFWALREVSFEVAEGEVVGIIGRNGAGKSTLLKVLSRITEPTSGRAVLQGRVGSLLEVGTGFHPELTGRENIYLNGAVLGMRKSEITRRFDEIAAFAEIDQFLDTPVKRYSSGMYVRLAFAVAAHLEPEILVVDEVLAVGDTAFQKKCLGKMSDVASSGRTVLFVSHNMAAVKALCSRCVVLDKGRVITDGEPDAAIAHYASTIGSLTSVDLGLRADRRGTGSLKMTAFVAASSTNAAGLVCGEPGELRITFRREGPVSAVQVSVGVFSESAEGVAYLASEVAGVALQDLPDEGTIVCRIDSVPLLPGRYGVNLFISNGGTVLDWVEQAASIDVLDGDYFGSGKLPPPGYGHVAVDHDWEIRHACEES